jgi:hypothetical protein
MDVARVRSRAMIGVVFLERSSQGRFGRRPSKGLVGFRRACGSLMEAYGISRVMISQSVIPYAYTSVALVGSGL